MRHRPGRGDRALTSPRLDRLLRIGQVAPPAERVPPLGYGGTERVIDELARELARRGHDVVLFASGDSEAPGRHVATIPVSLRAADVGGDTSPWTTVTQLIALRHQHELDILHGHLDFHNLVLARAAEVPFVGTFHSRLDRPFAAAALEDPPAGLVAISRAQAGQHPEVPWAGVVHNGLSLKQMPFGRDRDDSLCFVGRITPEKGVIEAIEIARTTGRPLRIAAKVPYLPWERQYHDEVFVPALAGADVEMLGELGPVERDALLASSHATLMPGEWPEPFGLTAIESLACGTPVICRPVGALPEIVRDGVDGFTAPDVAGMAAAVERVGVLDRSKIRTSVVERFSAERMADGYEEVYARMLSGAVTRT